MPETPAPLPYRTPTRPPPPDRRLLPSKLLAAYLPVSLLTLPFANSLWIGELPPLLLLQIPKILPHRLMMDHVLLPAIRHLGLSVSASPDRILATPYALALTYLLYLLPALALPMLAPTPSRLRWALLLVALAVTDYLLTLYAPGRIGLSFL